MKFINSIKGNSLIIIYALIMVLLAVGVHKYTGYRYFDELGIYFFSFLFFYFIGKLLVNQLPGLKTYSWAKDRFEFPFSFSVVSVVLIMASMGIHFYQLRSLPLVDAWNAQTILETAKIRQSITQHAPVFINYMSSFVIKGFIPFFLLLFYITGRKKMFLILLIASLFYVLNLLQKNYLIIIFAPLITWLFLEKRVISFIGYSLIPVLGIFFLVYVTNPENRLQKGNVNAKEMVHTTEKSAFGIRNRMIYVPGKIVAEWFSRIPSEMPFLNGCGYHFAARFMGCEYVNYSKILYEKIYPGYAEEGLRGTVNTASFVYDYANFGKPGLVLSAFVMALLFLFLQWLFAGNWKWLLVFNAFSVVMLSSAALTTLMFSGGWGLRILLFFLFRKQLQNPVI